MINQFRLRFIQPALAAIILILGGCGHPVANKDRPEYARRFLEKDLVPYNVYDRSMGIREHLYLSKEEKEAVFKMTRMYNLTSPVKEVRESFIQSLSRSIDSGKFVDMGTNSIDFCASQLDGWITFSGYGFLEKMFSTYELQTGVEVYLLASPGCDSFEGYQVWHAICGNKIKDLPLQTWLANEGEKIKQARAEVIERCGEELANDLVNYLQE